MSVSVTKNSPFRTTLAWMITLHDQNDLACCDHFCLLGFWLTKLCLYIYCSAMTLFTYFTVCAHWESTDNDGVFACALQVLCWWKNMLWGRFLQSRCSGLFLAWAECSQFNTIKNRSRMFPMVGWNWQRIWRRGTWVIRQICSRIHVSWSAIWLYY